MGLIFKDLIMKRLEFGILRVSNSLKFFMIILLAGLFLLNSSCRKEKKGNNIFDAEFSKNRDIRLDSLNLETIELDSVASSHLGFVAINNDTIQFIDSKYNWVFLFDHEGTYIGRELGQGKGPGELPINGIQFYCPVADKGYFFLGSSYDCHFINKNYERTNSYLVDWNTNVSPKLLQKKPRPKNPRSYNLAYGIGNVRATSTHVYLPLAPMLPTYSAFNLTTDLYAGKARTLAKMNIENGKIEKIIGRLSPLFSENESVRVFSAFKFDIINGNEIAITYLPDPHIYITDLAFQSVKSIFGYPGKNMDLNYEAIPSTDDNNELRKYWENQQNMRGYYNSLEYIEERDMIFRGYTRGDGSNSKYDGLQIYNDQILIADVNVPKTFEVKGYIAPYFYSNAFVDTKTGKIKIYRFKIEE